MHRAYEEATLAGLPGEGYLEQVTTDDGERVREGCWKTERGEEIYAELREKYLARETLTYRDAQGDEIEVFIASWFGVGHPDCLVIRSVEER
jgi:hypothetical protein